MKMCRVQKGASISPAGYEPPRAARLGHSLGGAGGGLPCGAPGSGAFGNCSTGLNAGVDCLDSGSAADICEGVGSTPEYA